MTVMYNDLSWRVPSCLEWDGFRNSRGYGMKYVSGSGRQSSLVHRVAWEEVFGEITDPEICVLHKCDNPACYEVRHLFLGTRADNNKDKQNKGREARNKGEKNGRSKLTQEQADEIRIRYGTPKGRGNNNHATQITQKQLAAEYGVSQHSISQIVFGKRYISGLVS